MNKFETLFVDKEVAYELKKHGFNEPCFARVYKKQFRSNFLCETYDHNSGVINKEYTSVPLIQQVVFWLKEKYNIEINIYDKNINDIILTKLKSIICI